MTFAHPYLLILLPLILLLRRPRTSPITVSSVGGWQQATPSRRITWQRRLHGLRKLAAGLLLVAMAGPRTEDPVNDVVRQGIAIEMLVDISSSMDISMAGQSSRTDTRMAPPRQRFRASFRIDRMT